MTMEKSGKRVYTAAEQMRAKILSENGAEHLIEVHRLRGLTARAVATNRALWTQVHNQLHKEFEYGREFERDAKE